MYSVMFNKEDMASFCECLSSEGYPVIPDNVFKRSLVRNSIIFIREKDNSYEVKCTSQEALDSFIDKWKNPQINPCNLEE